MTARPARGIPFAHMAFAALCVYEAGAVASGRAPTVSDLCRRRRWVEAGLFCFLLVHLHQELAP